MALQGSLRDFSIADILQLIALQKKTGLLTLKSSDDTVTLGFSESLFEVAAAAVTAAGGTDKAKIAAALKTMKVDTLVGNLDWNSGPFPNIAKTPLVGAQWRKTDGGQFPYELVIVSNAHAKEQGLDVPLGGKVEPLSGS